MWIFHIKYIFQCFPEVIMTRFYIWRPKRARSMSYFCPFQNRSVPVIFRAVALHQNLNCRACRVTSWTVCGFSEHRHLLFCLFTILANVGHDSPEKNTISETRKSLAIDSWKHIQCQLFRPQSELYRCTLSPPSYVVGGSETGDVSRVSFAYKRNVKVGVLVLNDPCWPLKNIFVRLKTVRCQTDDNLRRHFLLNCRRVGWIVVSSVQQYTWRCMNTWRRNKHWSVAREKPLLLILLVASKHPHNSLSS